MAQRKSESRPRDERGRFLPSDKAEAEPDDDARKGGDSSEEGRKAESIAAPSIGPNTTIERAPPEERLAQHEQSDVDAMGLDKRREVMGRGYGPSRAKQATVYGVFLAVVVTLGVGFYLLARELDQPPETQEVQAPWAQPGAEQVEPEPLDFPRNGQTDVGSGTGATDEGPQ